jgi:hypothetical protein
MIEILTFNQIFMIEKQAFSKIIMRKQSGN